MTITDQRTTPGLGAELAGQAPDLRGEVRRRSLGGYLFMPALVGVGLLLLYLWVESRRPLDSVEQQRVNVDFIRLATVEHIQLTLASTVLVVAIAIPLGMLLTRPFLGRVTRPAVTVFNIGQALPSIGLIFLFAIVWTTGFWPMVVALVAYTTLPVLRNTMVGLQQVDPAVIESARGMGMTKLGVLLRIELPLAVPIMMAGVRTALVINVGTAALAALVGAGGLGSFIVTGTNLSRELVTIVGAALIASLALLLDYVAGLAEDLLRPKGL